MVSVNSEMNASDGSKCPSLHILAESSKASASGVSFGFSAFKSSSIRWLIMMFIVVSLSRVRICRACASAFNVISACSPDKSERLRQATQRTRAGYVRALLW